MALTFLLRLAFVAASALALLSGPALAADPLTVHLVCHTHDDVGWQITVDEYYDREVRSIISTVVQGLSENPARKFMYVEQAFFQRWWREQNATTRALTQRLVAAKQLEFVNGGWCMHDEAGTHYVDMVDQTTLGHRYISQQFGVQPTTTWQIDPFGHSATQAALFGPLSGIDGIFFARIDYQDKDRRVADKELEMVWRASLALGEPAQVFAGAFAPGYGYGPPNGFCWDRGCRNAQVQNNRSLPGYNLDTFVDAFVQTAIRQANMTAGVNLMWTLGNDFAWQDADSWYPNLDKLIDGVNADGRVRTLYSTPSIYLAAKHAENLAWPLKTDDFFPYADGPDAYWTGYFTSRPALKRYVRYASGYLQVARQIEAFTGANGSVTQVLWEAQGVAQHHDGVSGTAKQAVTFDYAQRISVGYDVADAYIGRALGEVTTRQGGTVPTFATCPLANQSVCVTTQSNGQVVVLVYNPMARVRAQRIAVPWAAKGAVTVSNETGAAVPSQLVPAMANLARGADSAPLEVVFLAVTPGLGWATYFVTPASDAPLGVEAKVDTSDLASTLLRSVQSVAEEVARPLQRLASLVLSAANPTISNSYWTLTFDGSTGLLISATDRETNEEHAITQQFLYYQSYQVARVQDSGAYIFRPDQSNATATVVASAVTNFTTLTGPVVSEVRQVFGPWLTQIVRLTEGSRAIEFEYTVGHLPVDDGVGKEVISRFTSDIASGGVWYTDSNGREFQVRRRNFRPTWEWNATEVTAGNYYPCNTGAGIVDEQRGMVVINDRSQGCSSLQDGVLEFMVHRRLLHDDGRGVGEPLNEPGTDGQGLTITGTHYLHLTPSNMAAFASRTSASAVFSFAVPFYAALSGSTKDYISTHITSASALNPNAAAQLPPNVELMSVQISELIGNSAVLLVRLAHQFGMEDPEWSVPVTVDLGSLFAFAPSAVVELSLTANQRLGAHKPYDWQIKAASQQSAAEASPGWQSYAPIVHQGRVYNLTIAPGEIRTLNFTVGGSDLDRLRRTSLFM